jgi:transcriptional regulator with PAS, ATPase and Fis domain
VNEGTFRKDLFFRLNQLTINVPPLRERPLASFRSGSCSSRSSAARVTASRSKRKSLTSYKWPGNVRELRNVIERAISCAATKAMLGLEHLPTEILGGSEMLPDEPAPACGR